MEIYLGLKGHRNYYDTRELLKIFVGEVVTLDESENPESYSSWVVSELIKDRKGERAVVRAKINGKTKEQIKIVKETSSVLELDKKEEQLDIDRRNALRSALFEVMRALLDKDPSWGVLTGIRPVKIVQKQWDEGRSYEEIKRKLTEEKYVNETKAELLLSIAKKERQLIYPLDEKAVSIYISIPFCPTRCRYCSFPSNDLYRKKGEVGEYVRVLIKELEKSIEKINQYQIKVNTLYIGGGTPSVLSPKEFSELFYILRQIWCYDQMKEITVEAGRPDTFSEEMLFVIKENGVKRISLNPQSMNKETLELIGRDHTPKEIHKAYDMIRKVGFETVNMDLILGLPKETMKSLIYTLEEVKKLSPENITVHTLAIKTHSYFKGKEKLIGQREEDVLNMLKTTDAFMTREAYEPYYLYRQKNMLGNFENVGYSKKGHESIYNMKIMAEKETILGFGAGAVTKVVELSKDQVHRRPNVKGLGHYMGRIDSIIEEKKRIFEEFIL